jgi:hypothetical protein
MVDHKKIAQQGLELIEQSIAALLIDNSQGLSNVEIARRLGLETGQDRQKNYLTWAIVQEMVTRGDAATTPKPNHKTALLYVAR